MHTLCIKLGSNGLQYSRRSLLIADRLWPRKTGYFTPHSVPWEYVGHNSAASDEIQRRVSAPDNSELQPGKIEIDTRTGLQEKNLTVESLPGPLRKFAGVKRPNIHGSRPQLLPTSSSSSTPIPPVLTPAGEHPHDHGETILKSQSPTDAARRNETSAPETSKPIAEEGLRKRIWDDRRLKGHEDVRGYSHAAEDALHALSDRCPLPKDHPAQKRPEKTPPEEPHNIPLPDFPPTKPDEAEPTVEPVVEPMPPAGVSRRSSSSKVSITSS